MKNEAVVDFADGNAPIEAEPDGAWRARAALCELLALSFDTPGQVLLDAVFSGEWWRAACDFSRVLGLRAFEGEACVGGAPHCAEGVWGEPELHAMRAEATRLFVGAPKPAVQPYEGMWRALDDGVPGLLFVNPHTRDVERFCAACGIGRPKSLNEPIDHIVAELQTLQFLALAAAEDEAQGRNAHAEFPGGSAQAAFAQFGRDHFAVWVPRFAERVEESARMDFYALAAHLLDAFAKKLGEAEWR